MALSLNKTVFLILASVCACTTCFSQENEDRVNEKDYKDPDQFERFYKRRKVVASWQVNQLKTGALVVRLHTNDILINSLKKQGNMQAAMQKEAEQYVINKNFYRAYSNHYTFSKIYFMYSTSSDTLLDGARSGFFLDSNLNVDPRITMTETFYLIAERDYIYNSSIGFVPEDSAREVKEKGNPVLEKAIVIKNKYGHQLKAPFPYHLNDKANSNASAFSPEEKFSYQGKDYYMRLPKRYTAEKLNNYVETLDMGFIQFYRESPSPERSRNYADAQPFLY